MLFQWLCGHCKVLSGCVIFGCSSSPSISSRQNFGRSGRGQQPEFLEMLHEVFIRRSPQKELVTRDQSEKPWAILWVKMAAMCGSDVELLEKWEAVRNVLAVSVLFAWEKEKRRRALRRNEVAVTRRGDEKLKRGFDGTTSPRFVSLVRCPSCTALLFLGSAS